MTAEDRALYRIGRTPDPFARPPFDDSKDSGNRFDDPKGEFWVMYAAEQRQACFAETLARFRLDLELIARLRSLPDGDRGHDVPDAGIVPDDWHLKRMIGAFRVGLEQRWLDLRDLGTRETIRRAMAGTFAGLGLTEFDWSDALSRRRDVTQSIARWAYEENYQGIVYTSRLDAAFDCWAIFEGATYEILNTSAIVRDDPDLLAIAEIFALRLVE